MSDTLVTGGSKRLGREICLTLAKQKKDLVIHYYKSQKEAYELAEECRSYGGKATIIQGSFSTIEEIHDFTKRLTKEFPNIQNLVNNVGNYLIKSILKTSLEELSDLFSTNLYAPLFLIQALLDSIKNKGGSIINLGVCGIKTEKAECYSTAYSLTKTSLLMLTKSLAKELAPFNVAVNMVSPGILEDSVDVPDDINKIPMKRLGTFKEVAELIGYLLHPNHHYITGQNIEVAGGVRL